VFLHGALKSAFSMKRLEKAFARRGYQTFNWDYDSRNHTVEQNAAMLDSIVTARGYDQDVMHFVTHSMGALVARYYLTHYSPPRQGRFVMIAPPNQGSILATELQDFPPFRWIYKKNVDQLVMGDSTFAANLGIPECEFGIIAGGTGGKYGFTWYLPGDDDSVLSVKQTRLSGASDFVLVNHVHATIMREDDTIRNAMHFIEDGSFIHGQGRAEVLSLRGQQERISGR